MNIGIIGTGNMGSGLGKLWARSGHQIMFSSREPEKAKALVNSMGPNASAGTVAEAVQFGEAVLLAVPWASIEDAIKEAGPLDGKILIDCTNPLTRTSCHSSWVIQPPQAKRLPNGRWARRL